jgi:DNA-binding Lrp family transcriptional regulator
LELSHDDRRLLDLVQAGFPLVEEPFRALAESLGSSEDAVLERMRRLREERVIRQIGAIFDTRSLGYESSLVAMKIAPASLDAAVEAVNAHPGVSHNYERNHEFNLWFTVAVPPASRLGLERTIERLHELTSAESTRQLTTLRLYKIGVRFDMSGEGAPDATSETAAAPWGEAKRPPEPGERVRSLVRALQEDLPLEPRPFQAMAVSVGSSAAELLAAAQDLLARGIMRRYAAVLHHRRAGFVANAMGVWRAPEGRIDECGRIMAGFNAVSHCYRRPTYPDWPYALFSMVHGRDRAECEIVLRTISGKTGLDDYLALYSTREFKKVRVRYFDPAFDEWEERCGGEAPC